MEFEHPRTNNDQLALDSIGMALNGLDPRRKRELGSGMRADLITITQNVWSRLFRRAVEASVQSVSEEPHARGLCSGIRMNGSDYALIIHATDHVVRQWAGTLFDCEPAECTDADLIDVIGELGNVLAGGFKHRLGASVHLGLPDARFEKPLNIFDDGHAEISILFMDDDKPFWVLLWRCQSHANQVDTFEEQRNN